MFVFAKDSNTQNHFLFHFSFGNLALVCTVLETQAVKMENAAVIMIRSSEEEKGEGNGSNEKKIECGVAIKSKLDEYREISDLTGFENLKAMILAESVMKRKKRNKTKKKKDKTKIESAYRETADLTGFDSLKAMIEAEASKRRKSRKRKRNKIKSPENETINVAEEQGQLGKNDGLNNVEVAEEQRQLGENDGLNNGEVKERNRSQERRRRRKRAKLEEYEKISDLGGFENLKAMIEAEDLMRRKKRGRKNRNEETDFCVQEDVSVNAEVEKRQMDENEGLKVVEVSKSESVQTSEMDEPRHLFIDPAKENEGAGAVEAVQMIRSTGGDNGGNSVEVVDLCLSSSEDDRSVSDASLEISVEDSAKAVQTRTTTTGANDGINCVEVIDLCSSPSEDDKPISDVTLGRSVEVMVPVGPVARESKRRRRRRRRKKKRVITAKDKVEDAEEENDAKYNIVLRMLLRKPRYFDPLDWNFETCSNCGKENHTAASCKVHKKNKPCFLCASFKHSWKNCKQGQDCFISRATDQLVNDSLQTDQGNNLVSNICLMCGDSGHDMFSCGGDYLANDLKEIQCYVCKSFGHLCCVNPSYIDVKQVSCYNCGQSGHFGHECTKSCESPDGMKSNIICYKCGKEGHFARRCGGHFKDRLRLSDLL